MSSQKSMSEKLIDRRFNIFSYDQYLIDNQEKRFNKICMNEVVNADLLIATFGEEKFYKVCAQILQMGNEAYKKMGIDHLIHVYIYNYKSFMAVANKDMSDDDFYSLMQANYEHYKLYRSKETKIGGVSRFIMAFGDNLINRVKSASYVHQSGQDNFIIVKDEKEQLEVKHAKNLELFELIPYALTNNKLIPYYQGIYDNNTGEITKYEALMRIVDKEGNIRTPDFFLSSSKELKLYLPISRALLDKAMSDFEDKESELALNISLFDIQSKDFKDWFLKRVKNHPNPSKITIEFVETENYNDEKELESFLAEVREIGCKIAIDDFGVGFATYTSIMSVKPDIIKIDGDIIKNLTTSNDSNLILDAICYMARLINAEITAEYVEDAATQKILIDHNVHYSQGYHFSKPLPIHEIAI